MRTLFISHSSEDHHVVSKIKEDLQRNGFSSYIATQDPCPGQHISSKIERAIKESDAVIVIVSNASNKSPWVQQEIGYAKARKAIIPIRIDDSKPPAMLEGIDCLNYSPDLVRNIKEIIDIAIKNSKQNSESEFEICDEGPHTINPGEYLPLPLNVESGETIIGRIEEENGETFDWYIVDETNLVEYKNNGIDDMTSPECDEDVGASQVKWKVLKRPKGPWYLILTMCGKKNPREIRVLLRHD